MSGAHRPVSGTGPLSLNTEEVTLVAESWHFPACRREQPGFLHEASVAVQCSDAVWNTGRSKLEENSAPSLIES
jgi:hypothetical protein